MKLFGGKKGGEHIGRQRPAPTQETAPRPAAEHPPAGSGAAPSGAAAAPEPAERGSPRRRWRLVLTIAVVVLAAAAALGVAHAVLVRAPATKNEGLNIPGTIRPAVENSAIATPPPDAVPTQKAQEETAPTAAPEPAAKRRDGVYTFVLLVSDQVSGGTDTILTGQLDTRRRSLDLVNIPRDTLVNVSWPVKKANSIYVNENSDPDRFIADLSGLVGFGVDHYAVMNLKAVARIVDAMGGVDFNMPRSMDYDDPTQNLSIHISAGAQHLSGTDVVKALRFRVGNDGSGYPDGDLGRIHFQQTLLKSVASQLLSVGNIPNLPKVLEAVTDNVKTDLTSANLSFFAEQFLLMDKDNVNFYMAPGTAISIRGGSYYELNVNEWLEMLNTALNPYDQPVTEKNLDVLHYLGAEGAISTTGDTLPLSSFYDFYSYTG